MTIVTAIICKSAIILAGDSRTTNEDGTVRNDTKKISRVFLQDGFPALVGQSGNYDLGSQAVELLSELAKQNPFKDYRSVADLAVESIKQLKNKIRQQFHGTSDELQRHFESHNFDLLIAHYYKEKNKVVRPLVFRIQFSLGMATLMQGNFISIGCGSPLAEFILDGFNVSEMDYASAMATVVYAIEQVKKFDPRCGGKTTVAETEFWPQSSVYCTAESPDDFTNDVLKALAEIESETKMHQRQLMTGFMERLTKLKMPEVEKIKNSIGPKQFVPLGKGDTFHVRPD